MAAGAPEGDYRDWTAIKEWAAGIAAALERQTRPAEGPQSKVAYTG